MIYAFINNNYSIEKQRLMIKNIIKQKNQTIDVWLELNIHEFHENIHLFLSNEDTLVTSDLEILCFANPSTAIQIMRYCLNREINVLSKENLDKSPFYSICLINKKIEKFNLKQSQKENELRLCK